MSEKLPPEKKGVINDSCSEYQRNKAPTKIPGTAVFRSPYSVSSKTAGCSPYYVMTSTGTVGPTVSNASDEDKRRIMHNEVERKRKDKINKWIVRLCTLVPDCNGKLSKNCILEKTVNFIQLLMQEKKLPDDVQALKTEVIKLTKNVESLSSENAHYLTLLKEAQHLSKGAWTLNMSIQRNSSTSQSSGHSKKWKKWSKTGRQSQLSKLTSSGSDGDDTTMTPTLDRVSVSNLTKASSAPNLPAIVPAPPKPQTLITVPIMTASGQPAITAQSVITGQPIKVNLQPQTGSTKIGSMVTALSANQLVSTAQSGATLVAASPIVANGHPIVANANGHPILANGLPLLANVQVKDGNVIKSTANGASHSIQALLGGVGESPIITTNSTNALYSLPAYLQPLSNTECAAANVYMATQNSPLVAAQPQTPVLVQGENGPVVIMLPGSLPHFSVPLNTMSSHQVICEPTSYFKSPIICNQFPSLLNYAGPDTTTNQAAKSTGLQFGSVIQGPQVPSQNTGLQFGSVIQGPQGQQSVVVGTQPVIAQTVLPTQQQTVTVPTVMQQAGQTVVGVQPTGQAMVGVQATGQTMVGVQATGQTMVGVQAAGQTMVGVQQAGQTMMGVQAAGQTMVGVQQSGQTMMGIQTTGTPLLKVVSGNGDHTLIQVPNSEAVLIPQSNVTVSTPTQCFIPLEQVMPVHQVCNPAAVTVTPVTSVTPVTPVLPHLPVTTVLPVSTAALTPSKNTNVTDFSISQIHGLLEDDTKQPMDASGDIYLTSASDASFSSECFTPPYSSANVLLSSANFRDTMSPDGEGNDNKPLAHSIASLTGMNN